MLGLLTPRVVARSAGRYRQLELDDSVFSRSRTVLEKALQDGKPRTQHELLAEANIPATGGQGLHILGHWAQKGLICFGPRIDKQPSFVLLDEWVPKSRALEREEALAELARRYFRSHGPATLQDFVWWSGLTVADAKMGLELVNSELTHADVDGETYWFEDADFTDKPAPQLLPFFDEFLVAYKDRSAVLEAFKVRQVNAGGGLLNPTIVLDGKVVGTWKRRLEKSRVLLTVSPFTPFDKTQMKASEIAAERYGKFLGLPVVPGAPSERSDR